MSAPLAYLDPGTGSMLLQVIVGGAAAAAVGLKMFWRRVLNFLHLGKRPESKPETSR